MDSEIFLSPVRPSLIQRAFSYCKAFITNLDWEIKLLLAVPIALIFFKIGWLFFDISRTSIDPWIYFGYFIDLKQHLNTFAETYYGTRLPWILPGFLVYKFFSPLVANYILHLLFYYFSTISLFLILKYTINRRTALLTCVLMSSYFYFIQPIGSNYIDGAGITYLFLTLLMLTPKENSQNPGLRLLTAGIFFGCLIYTQLFLITYIPFLIAYCFFMKREYKKLSLMLNLSFFFYGFVVISLVLCAINYCLNGSFWFFRPIINWTVGFVSSVNPWWTPISIWWTKALWLLLPAITLFGSLLFLIFKYRKRSLQNWRFLLFFQAYFVANLLMFVLLEIFVKQPVLRYAYYTSYLIPIIFLAIGSQFSMFISMLSGLRYYLLLSVIVFISFLPYAFPMNPQSIQSFYPLLISLALGIAGFFVIHHYYPSIGVVLIFISLAVINILGLNSQFYLTPRHDSVSYKKSFLSIMKGAQSVLSMDPQIKAFFWYDLNEPSGSIFRCISSMNLWGYRLINEEFPKICGKDLYHRPNLHDRIFLLSNKENSLEEANKGLASLGFIGELIDEKTIAHANLSYKISFIKISEMEKISPEVRPFPISVAPSRG